MREVLIIFVVSREDEMPPIRMGSEAQFVVCLKGLTPVRRLLLVRSRRVCLQRVCCSLSDESRGFGPTFFSSFFSFFFSFFFVSTYCMSRCPSFATGGGGSRCCTVSKHPPQGRACVCPVCPELAVEGLTAPPSHGRLCGRTWVVALRFTGVFVRVCCVS